MDFDINEVKRRMLIKYPFFGSVITNVTFKETKQISIAGTNGREIFYNIDSMSKKNINEQVFILSHEVLHIAFDHVKREKGKDHDTWNIATDAVINAFLEKDGFDINKDYIYYPDAINYTAEEYYEKLIKENKENPKPNINNHEYWDKPFQEELNEELEKSIKEISSIGEKEAFEENKKMKKENLKKLRNELIKQSNVGTSTDSKIINDIEVGESTKYIDWRLLLREAINLDVDWSYSNASIEDGVVTPYLEEIMKPQAEILLDTSGSINRQLLINFLKECKNIINTAFVKVGCFDTEFYGFCEVRNEEEIEKLEFRGQGGTDFDVAVDSFSNRVENKIIFTDGDASMPKKRVDAIWIVYGNKKIKPKGGRVINITEDQFEKLKIAKKVFK